MDTMPVPREALDRVQAELSLCTNYADSLFASFAIGPIRKLAAFADQFTRKALPGMSIGMPSHEFGQLREIALSDDSVSHEEIDLIRLNGRVYVPEVIADFSDNDIGEDGVPELFASGFIAGWCRGKPKGSPPADLMPIDEEIQTGWHVHQISQGIEDVVEAAEEEGLEIATETTAETLPDDVVALVIAGRDVWAQAAFSNFASDEEVAALDKALEAFASRVPYEDDPNACTCGADDGPASEHDLSCPMTVSDATISSQQSAISQMETTVTFEGRPLGKFEAAQRAEKFDMFAMSANEADIRAHQPASFGPSAVSREQARYLFAEAMMVERDKRGIV